MDIKTYISSGIIEAYALGTTSPEESAILECVMKNNTEVKNAVFEAQEVFEKLASAQAIDPPAYLQASIAQKIDFSVDNSKEGKIIPLRPKKGITNPASSFPTWLSAASVAIVFGLGYLGYEVNSKNTQLQDIAKINTELSTKVSGLEEMNSLLMNSKRIELKGVEKHPDMLADVYWHTSKKVFLEIKNLPAAPAGKQYQLWAIVDGKPMDIGMYDPKNDAAVQEMKSIESAEAFAITLEKEGGNAIPTMDAMYVMGTI